MEMDRPTESASGLPILNAAGDSAYAHLIHEFERLCALAGERVRVEWSHHQRQDLRRLSRELSETVVEFGRLLRVVFRYGLTDALRDEAAWYLATLGARGSHQDAFALVLESWIVAIQGLIKPPECNELTAPLQALRAALPELARAVLVAEQTPVVREVNALVSTVTNGDVAGAEQLLRTAVAKRPAPEAIVTDLLLPAMAEVGRRWERDELAIFEEHLATQTARHLLAILPVLVEPCARLVHVAVVACVPGDEHELASLALGTYLRLRGWQVRLLGGSLPAEEIARAVTRFTPHTLFLSLSMLSRLEGALEAVAAVHSAAPRCRIIVGGRGAHLARAVLERSGVLVASSFEDAHRLALAGPSHA